MSEEKEGMAGGAHGRSRKKFASGKEDGKKSRLPLILTAAAILTAGGAGGFYLAMAHTYEETFLPNTYINGVDASKLTVEEVMEKIEEGLSDYELKILDRTGAGEVIRKDEIGLHSEFDGSLEELLRGQEPMAWGKALGTSEEHEIPAMIIYDEKKLEQRILSLKCMQEENMEAPENAEISEYQKETKSYEIVPAKAGTTLVKENVRNAVSHAVQNLQTEVNLDAEACYTKPAVGTEDESLRALAAELNTYAGAVINYTFGNEKEMLDGDTIHEWISVNGNEVVIDEEQAAAYVRTLAKKYNTAYSSRKVKTSYGKTVTISGGSYGWRINETAETAALLDIVKKGEQQTREPEYLQKAASRGEYDYGDTYVEINLTAQHLFFYKDGKLLVETDLVSGNEARGWATPAGSYPLTYKQRNATLKGENYATPVSYWMPFNGGIGLHDANWRSSFGGTIYKTGGSHGCVNLPPSAAKQIFENISAGDPVLCYHLEGTESSAASKPAQPVPETTAAPETASETTAALETTAPVESTIESVTPETTASAPSVSEVRPAEISGAEPTPTPDVSSGPGGSQNTNEALGPGYAGNAEISGYGPGY